jgi:hypothetical protein
MHTETRQNDNGDRNSEEEKGATLTYDNAYTRGITKTFKIKFKTVFWGSFKHTYT